MLNKAERNHSKQIEVAKIILQTMGIVGLVAGIIVFPGLAEIVKWFAKETKLSPYQVRQSLYKMRKNKNISLKSVDKGTKIILTKKGERRLRTLSLRFLSVEKQKQWDGWWRVVMFDIPESVRTSRDLVRKHLLRLGFKQVHKSVFINPYPAFKAMSFLRDYYELPPGSLYILESKVLEGETELKKVFNLDK